MLYHAVRAVHRGYALTLFWLYIGLFGVAFLCIFVFPPATLALLFVGIFGLVVAYMGGVLLGVTENSLARSALRRSRCPSCGGAMGEPAAASAVAFAGAPGVAATDRTCSVCGARFESSGSEIDPEPSSSPDFEAAMTRAAMPNVSSAPRPEGSVEDPAAS